MPLRGDEYDARFARFEAEGNYLHGEADLVAELLGDPPASVLDAGCGTGRLAIELARRGYEVLGVELEQAMLDTARAKAPGLEWVLGDLSTAELPDNRYDLAVAAGNVMIFLELGTEAAVVANLARTVVPSGLVVAGFQVGRQLTLERYDALAAVARLQLVHRWATWERAPYVGGDYAVSVHRRDSRAVNGPGAGIQATTLHDAVTPLSFLLGRWAGEGEGSYPTIEAFGYGEEITLSHVGKPFLAYAQRTWSLDDGRPLHAETGYWRCASPTHVELVVAHPTGVVEVSEGPLTATSLVMSSRTMAGTGSAKDVVSVVRRITVEDGHLDYELDMAAVGVPLTNHLRAALRRMAAPSG